MALPWGFSCHDIVTWIDPWRMPWSVPSATPCSGWPMGTSGGYSIGQLAVYRGVVHGAVHRPHHGTCHGGYPWAAPWSAMDRARACAIGHPTNNLDHRPCQSSQIANLFIVGCRMFVFRVPLNSTWYLTVGRGPNDERHWVPGSTSYSEHMILRMIEGSYRACGE